VSTLDPEGEAAGIPTFEWKCPICRYECLRYGKESLRMARDEHLAKHDKTDRDQANLAATKDQKQTGPIFSQEDKKFLKSIGIKVNYGE
jgi:hypothetical protein